MLIVTSQEKILSLLYEFDEVFIHNREKVFDYAKWAEKIYTYGYALLMEVDRKIAGFAAIYANDIVNKIGYISLIGVKSDYRKQGLGSLFLQEILMFMTKQNMEICRLEVDKDNKNAIAFYERNGFSPYEERNNSFIYSKNIKREHLYE